MSGIQWIKLSVNMFDDEKIKLLEKMPEGNQMLIVWIRLLALAGKTNDKGRIYLNENVPYTEDM
ncbi:phage replisome organizer N-terminal domain-containing protein, partial [Escherichia coli]|nr:phage replisome organizer N-terminal domain-containing protein [Escherichia coli]